MSGFDLTAAFRKHGILKIADVSPKRDQSSFAVYIVGDIVGTGKTVGDALDCALRTRDLQHSAHRKAA